MDTVSKSVRSRMMSAVKGRNTSPEIRVRSLAHRIGYRFRLHGKDLPGRPDLVFRSRRKTVFVHGCFWHQHAAPKCPGGRAPKSNLRYWAPKLAKNVMRDQRNLAALKALKWKTLVVWECETANEERLAKRLVRFLGSIPGHNQL
jgi:DNA mismatch endonuclease, patch repair protein